MGKLSSFKLICNGEEREFAGPVVMGILNVTPDSFYSASRVQTDCAISLRAAQIINEGGTIIDIGACSTRPGSVPASEEEELSRLRFALQIIRKEFPDAILSIDTFRTAVARMCIEEYGVSIINDVSEGCDEMYALAGRSGAVYVLMSCRPDIETTEQLFRDRLPVLRDYGCKSVILDPGYGFGKSVEQNYAIVRGQRRLKEFGLPLLAGVSRKRMIWQFTESNPENALVGTAVVNAMCVERGADILRVHDVKEAVETIKIAEECF